MIEMKWIYLITYISGILSALWSVLRVFPANETTNQKQYWYLKLSSAAFWIYTIYRISVSELNGYSTVAGLVMSGFALVIFWWARKEISGKGLALIYSSTAPAAIATHGPYKYVRHPFYASYILLYLSAAVAAPDVVSFILFVNLFVLYTLAAQSEERLLLSGPHAQIYGEHFKQTGRFMPKITKKSA